jgi:glycosyltransferase involved in cell wall biosynthesis
LVVAVVAPLRVLHVCAGNLYGGIERIVAQCAASRGLAPSMEPLAAVCFEGRLSAELDAAGVPCARLGAARMRAPWTITRARRALARVIDECRPRVIVGHSAWAFALAAPVARRRGVVLAFWLHDWVTGRTLVERWARRTAPDLVIATSAFTRDSIPFMFPSTPSLVLHAPVPAAPPLEPGSRARLRERLGVPDDTPVVVTASRFERWKGHQDLLAALTTVRAPWRLWIAGGAQRAADMSYERALRQQAQALGIAARVSFLGERTDVPALMQAADLLCQPNTHPEPFGLVFVEALYAGLPVVTTDMGGPREVVTPACGVLVPPGDAGALRGALEGLLTDSDRRRKLGASGPLRAAELCDPARQLGTLARALSGLAPAAVPA